MMKYYKNGSRIFSTIKKMDLEEITKEEFETLMQEKKDKMANDSEKNYWNSINYEEAVDMKIREKYTVSQEFAILRQKDEKPEEYQTYYAYCEECKAFVKAKKGIE